jgi:hypothetical protein
MNEYPEALRSSPDDDPLLRGALEQQGGRVRVGAGLAERAIARDRSQRRRRAGVAALGAGLALAIAVPIVWSAWHPGPPRPVPVGPTSRLPSEPPTGSSAPSDDRTRTLPPTGLATPTPVRPTVLVTGGAGATSLQPAPDGPVGSTAAVYLSGGVIHDGERTVPLPKSAASPTGLARTSAGYLVLGVRTQADGTGMLVVGTDGGVLTTRPGITAVAVSPDREHVLASDYEGNLALLDARGTVVRRLAASTCRCDAGSGASAGYDAVGVFGRTAYASRGFTATTLAWDLDDGTRHIISADVRAVSPADGSVLVALNGPNDPLPGKPSDFCHELRGREATPRSTRWRLCGPLLLGGFSDDGRHLFATGTIDGLPHSQLAPGGTFLNPHVVVVRTSDAGVDLVGGTAFAEVAGTDPEGVVVGVVVSRNGTSTVQRCGPDGRCTIVAPPLRPPNGDDLFNPYLLSAN